MSEFEIDLLCKILGGSLPLLMTKERWDNEKQKHVIAQREVQGYVRNAMKLAMEVSFEIQRKKL